MTTGEKAMGTAVDAMTIDATIGLFVRLKATALLDDLHQLTAQQGWLGGLVNIF